VIASPLAHKLKGIYVDGHCFAVLDFETNSLTTCDPIEVAVVHLEAEGPRIVFESLIKPPRRISNREVHGITNRDIRNSPTYEEVFEQLLPYVIDRVVVAHNAKFDAKVFEVGLLQAGWNTEIPWLCTMELGALLTGQRLALSALAETLGIVGGGPAHRAGADALLAGSVFAKLLEHSTVVGEIEKRSQKTWQRDRFQDYLTALRTGQNPTVELDEPNRVKAHLVFAAEILNACVEGERFDRNVTIELAEHFKKLETLGWKPGEVI